MKLMSREVEKVPVGVIVIERHGRVQTHLKFPIREQGKYPLTPEAEEEARILGGKLFEYLQEQGIVRIMQNQGAYLHFAPSDYVRAIQTGHYTSAGLKRLLEENQIEVKTSTRHGRSETSLRFLQIPLISHYPEAGSKTDERWKKSEALWTRGEKVVGWEGYAAAARRTKTPGKLRKFMVNLFADKEAMKARTKKASSIPIYNWISHGPGTAAEQLTIPTSPIGLALNHLLTPAEREQFHIPVEIVRGHAVAAIVYSDGSVHAKHLKPK